MTNGYKIVWTNFALKELEQTIKYLEGNWSDKELKHLASAIEQTLRLISQNPYLFANSETRKDIRRVVIAKNNTMYYRVFNDTVQILSFFSNRQNPNRRKFGV